MPGVAPQAAQLLRQLSQREPRIKLVARGIGVAIVHQSKIIHTDPFLLRGNVIKLYRHAVLQPVVLVFKAIAQHKIIFRLRQPVEIAQRGIHMLAAGGYEDHHAVIIVGILVGRLAGGAQQIHRNHLVALALELLAVLIIIDPLHASLDPTGALLAIASALVFSFYSVVGKKRTPRFGGIAVTCFSFLFGSVELLAVLLLGRTAAVGGLFASLGLDIFVNVPLFSGIPLSALPALAYICAVNSAAGYVCHMMALEKTSAQEASLIFFLKPMIAPLFAFLFLREEITANMLLGIVCFLVGSGIAILPGLIAQKKQRA